MSSSASSKLSYLQKYLSQGDSLPGTAAAKGDGGKKKKKKKKKEKEVKQQQQQPGANVVKNKHRSRIIDADEVFEAEDDDDDEGEKGEKGDRVEDDDAAFDTLEDRPQVAGFVDERPEIEIMKERFTTSTFQAVIKIEDDTSDEDSGGGKKKHFSDVRVKEEPLDDDDDYSPRRKRRSSADISPPRIKEEPEEYDNSPPRRRRDSPDNSPPRRRRDSPDNSPPRRRRDSPDNSPPRIRRNSPDNSPPRKRKASSDRSPPRRARRRSSSDISPPRMRVKQEDDDDDNSPPRRKRRENDDLSPPRKMSQTLDGKRAGLQNAKAMKEELDKLKRKEQVMFEQLSSDVSGRGAATQVRGRLKAKEEEERRKKEKNEITEEVKKKYSRWSKGVRQAEEIQARIANDLYEMDKPLARSADDVDLDAHLKNIERSEDPMLAYIRKKKVVQQQSGGKIVPTYQGPNPAPNRFGIRPGYRWDGVDRSNGFEKKLFQRQNAKKSLEEDSYKWSTEDM